VKKKNIINGITARFDRLRKKVRSVFFALLQYIKDKLVQKEKVDSRISGTSSVKRKKSRKGSKINAEITRKLRPSQFPLLLLAVIP
jgi:nucleoid DNA-binding protein